MLCGAVVSITKCTEALYSVELYMLYEIQPTGQACRLSIDQYHVIGVYICI